MRAAELRGEASHGRAAAGSAVERFCKGIIDAVAREGDAAVARFSQRFDGSAYERIEVSADEIAEAFERVSPEDRDARPVFDKSGASAPAAHVRAR